MRRIAKHNATQIAFNDFSGGINVASTGDLIAQNELQTCQNFWFLGNQRSLAPRGGLSAAQSSIGADIVGTFYDIDSNTLLIFGTDQSIFRLTELGASPESIGKLTGKRRPVCAKFQDKLWIASGDKLQYYDAVGAATTLFFALPITDVFETLDKVIVAAGASLYELSDEYLDDAGQAIEYVAQLKDTVSTNKMIVRSVDTDMAASQAADVSVVIDNMNITMPANARRKVRCNHSTPKIQVTVSSKSPFQLKHVIVEVADL